MSRWAFFTAGLKKVDSRSETPSAKRSSCPRCYTGKSLPQASRALSQIIQSQSSVEKALLQKCCKDPPPRPTSVAALDHFPAWRGAQAHAGGNQTNCPSFRVVLVIPKSMSVGEYGELNTNTLTPTFLYYRSTIQVTAKAIWCPRLHRVLRPHRARCEGCLWRSCFGRTAPKVFNSYFFLQLNTMTRIFICPGIKKLRNICCVSG